MGILAFLILDGLRLTSPEPVAIADLFFRISVLLLPQIGKMIAASIHVLRFRMLTFQTQFIVCVSHARHSNTFAAIASSSHNLKLNMSHRQFSLAL